MWEKIAEGTERLKVYEGWLVRTSMYATFGTSGGLDVGLVFVPDPFHNWELEKLQELEELQNK